jgi:predicted lysophospholipase L1 biosynthesis ABC-type transport system permease subunit
MTVTDREQAVLKAFGAYRRSVTRQTILIFFAIGLISGLYGAYYGAKRVLILFAAIATFMAVKYAIAHFRTKSSGDHDA